MVEVELNRFKSSTSKYHQLEDGPKIESVGSRSIGGFRKLKSNERIGYESDFEKEIVSTTKSVLKTENLKPFGSKSEHKILHKIAHRRGPCYDENARKSNKPISNNKLRKKLPNYKKSIRDMKIKKIHT